MMRILFASILMLLALQAGARDRTIRADFQRMNPCPANDERRGSCPGWVVDHVVPLCAGGADHVDNMQWQPLKASRIKDAQERATCRKLSK